MRLGIIGSRNCKTMEIDDIIRYIPDETVLIISGGAAGIDTLAEKAAQRLGISFRKILPDYAKFGKRAPLVRNKDIVKNVDSVLAFWDYQSRGTASVIAYCIERDVPVEVIGIEPA